MSHVNFPTTTETMSTLLRWTGVSAWKTQLNTSVFRLPCSLLSSFPIVQYRIWGRSHSLCSGRGLGSRAVLWPWAWPLGFAGLVPHLAFLLRSTANGCCWICILIFSSSAGSCLLSRCLSFSLASQDWRALWNSSVSKSWPLAFSSSPQT